MIACPRQWCEGSLYEDALELNTLRCLLCEREWMRLNGALVPLRRVPTPDDRVGVGSRRQ